MSELLPYNQEDPWEPSKWKPMGHTAEGVKQNVDVWSEDYMPLPKFNGPYIKGIKTAPNPMYDCLMLRIILELPDANSYWTTKKSIIGLQITNELLCELKDSKFLTKFIIDRVAGHMLDDLGIKIDVNVEYANLDKMLASFYGEISHQILFYGSQLDSTKTGPDEYKLDSVSMVSNVGTTVQTTMQKVLPAMLEEVTCPLCGFKMPLKSAIIHLNDRHKMSREDQADWTETLDLDLEFKEPLDNG